MNTHQAVIKRIKNYARLERILALVCMTAPALMIIGDNATVRDSISDYYSMSKSMLFYVPLSIAFMLFIVNGIVRHGRAYNTVLGIALAGLVVFDYDNFKSIHIVCAAAFFIGSAAVMVIYTPKSELWFRMLLVSIIVLSLSSWALAGTSLFWAEWISLLMIGLHYILESFEVKGIVMDQLCDLSTPR